MKTFMKGNLESCTFFYLKFWLILQMHPLETSKKLHFEAQNRTKYDWVNFC